MCALRTTTSKPTAVLSVYDKGMATFLASKLGMQITVFGNPNAPEDPDLLVFTDGPPVNPFMWGERINSNVRVGVMNTRRDQRELRMFRHYGSSVPRIGVGRGAIMLNVLNFGNTWQHATGHDEPHDVVMCKQGVLMKARSNHKQMMIPSAVMDYKVIGSANKAETLFGQSLIKQRTNDEVRKTSWLDPEIIFYPNTTSLCWQPSISVDGSVSTEYSDIDNELIHYMDRLSITGDV